MPDQPKPIPPPVPPAPPPAPPPIVSYATPATDEHAPDPHAGGLVNLRWQDNLIQLGAVAVGLCLGGVVGAVIGMPAKRAGPTAVAGGILGMIAALFVSGLVLGILRRRPRKRR